MRKYVQVLVGGWVLYFLVPGTGLEPAHLSAIPPQGIMSTNFNTRALLGFIQASPVYKKSRTCRDYFIVSITSRYISSKKTWAFPSAGSNNKPSLPSTRTLSLGIGMSQKNSSKVRLPQYGGS